VAETKFAERAKGLLVYIPGLGHKISTDELLHAMEQNRKLGQEKRDHARTVYREAMKLPVEMNRFQKYTDQQKKAFGQMMSICMAKVFRKQMTFVGNVYPEVTKTLGEVLRHRHTELLTLYFELVKAPKVLKDSKHRELVDSVLEQYTMHCAHYLDSDGVGDADLTVTHEQKLRDARFDKSSVPRNSSKQVLTEQFVHGPLGIKISPESGSGWLVTDINAGGEVDKMKGITQITAGAILVKIDKYDLAQKTSDADVATVLGHVEGDKRTVHFIPARASAPAKGEKRKEMVAKDTQKEASMFVEALKVEKSVDKYCLLRDLTSVTLASGHFDTSAVAFLKLLASEIDVVPEAIDEWAADAGKNIWEAYNSDKRETIKGTAAWKIAAGVLVGGIALGATGGLAVAVAPAAFGAVGGALGGAVGGAAGLVGLQGAGAAAAITGAFATTAGFLTAIGPAVGGIVFGASGAGLAGVKLQNRWGDLSNFDFVPVRKDAAVTKVEVWRAARIEQIDLVLEDESVIIYGSRSEHAKKKTLTLRLPGDAIGDESPGDESPEDGSPKGDKSPKGDRSPRFAEMREYIVEVSGTSSRSKQETSDDLCESLIIVTSTGRRMKFSGSAHGNGLARAFGRAFDKNAPTKFHFKALKDHSIEGFDFHSGTCLRVHNTPTDPANKEKQGAGAVNWTLFVSGWVLNMSDFTEPWMRARNFFPSSDHFALQWENKRVIKLGHFLVDRMKSDIGQMAAEAWLKGLVIGVGAGAVMWPWAVTKSLMDLDNDWTVIMERVKTAGKCLASVIADTQQVGNRPVTLCGHSMGAAVVFACLQELYKLKKFYIVKDVILLGAPIGRNEDILSRLGVDAHMWCEARAVVHGRFINGYTSTDWLLAFLFRYMEKRLFVAGLQPVEGIPGIENVDLTGIVQSHSDYMNKSDLILQYLGFH